MPLPQPPIRNMTEFVVFAFVSIVAFLLTVTTVVTSILQALNPDRDYSAVTNNLTDILTTLIGALIGYIAGRGSGKAEVHEDYATGTVSTPSKRSASRKTTTEVTVSADEP